MDMKRRIDRNHQLQTIAFKLQYSLLMGELLTCESNWHVGQQSDSKGGRERGKEV